MAPKTNGLAIASLVLSLLWFAGLGSLLAIIFALSARRSIKRSQGREAGDSLAIAGLVIGILGVLGSVLFFGAVAAVNHEVNAYNQTGHVSSAGAGSATTTPTAGSSGSTLTTSGGDRVTVQQVTFNPPMQTSDFLLPTPSSGNVYFGAEIQGCADHTQLDLTPIWWSVYDAQGNKFLPDLLGTASANPTIPSSALIGKCVSGWVVFQVPQTAKIVRLVYWPEPFQKYDWTVS